MDRVSRNNINDVNPGSEKAFRLKYLNVEEREVTVRAKTVQEAFRKATKEVARRKGTGYSAGTRLDEKFIIRNIAFLKNGIKKFTGAAWGSIDYNNHAYDGLVIEPADLESLDNNNQAA